jgi:hypothetical protein
MEENTQILEKLDKFLFFFQIRTLAREFCCGCRLIVGNILISVIFIIFLFFHILSIISTINDSKLTSILMIFISLNLLVSSVLILISTLKRNVKLAYYGYLINAGSFCLEIITYFIFILLVQIGEIDLELGSNEDLGFLSLLMVIIMFIIFFLLLVFFRVYILWINFSFLKYLARGENGFLEGRLETSSNISERINTNL